MANIHPTALVDSEVILGENITIGAYSIIKGKTHIGNNTTILEHVIINGPVEIGSGNIFHPGVVIGGPPQDHSYKGEPTSVFIGNNNVLREHVTVNRATTKASKVTCIGNDNLFMAYSHVAHDCLVGDHCVFPNAATLGGHVIVGDRVHLGGLTGVHQFTTIGSFSFIGFGSRITKDVPPFMIIEGNPAEPRTINQIGLLRNGFSESDVALLKKAHKVLYRSTFTLPEKIEQLSSAPFTDNIHIKALFDFIVASAQGKNGRAQEKNR